MTEIEKEKSNIPLYKDDMITAKENGEMDVWRMSFKENCNCAKAIDKALNDNYADNRLDTDKTLDAVLAEYSVERVTHVLAAQVVNHDWDGRYHNDVKAWAKEQTKELSAEFMEDSRDYYLNAHPILIDGLATKVMRREKELEKTISEVKTESDVTEPPVQTKDKSVEKTSEKKLSVPEAPQSAQDKVKEITDRLEAGLKALFEGDNFKNYLNTMSKFHNYSFNNTMLIALQKPDATYVAGFNKWKKDFERSVNKGEKGIKIFAPAPYKLKKEQEKLDPDTDKPILDKDGNPVMEEVEVTIPAFKVVSVFDVSQTSGKELPTLGVDELQGNVEDFEKFFGVLKEVSPVPIKLAEIDGSAKGFYHQEDKDITIKQGMPEIQTVKTAIHEIAHAKLHDRDLKKADIDSPKKDRSTEEVEAESIAYTVCQHFGIDTSDYSFAYVASWGSGKDTPELKSSLETIRSTASELITQIEDKLRELEKERTVDKAVEVSENEQTNSVGQSDETVDLRNTKQQRNSNIIGNTSYKDIENKAYLKIQTSQLPTVEKYLEGANIPYSGRKTGKSTTITVSEKDYLQLCNYVNELTGKTAPGKETPRNSNIIGNAKYTDIPDKFFVRLTAAKAQEIAAVLEKNGVQFSGRIEGDKATLTISKADKDLYKQLTMPPEEIVKKTRASVVEAMAEYDEAEKAAVIAEDKLDTAVREYEEVKDENGEISDPDLKETLSNNLRSAFVEKEKAENNLSDKEAALNMAAAEFEAASSATKVAPEYTGRLPDMIPIAQMEAYGYKFVAENEMLPLEADRATQLAGLGAEIYRLYEDNSEGLIEDLSEIKEHKGLFGIEKAEWEKMMPVIERVETLKAEQPKREEFLYHSNAPVTAGIYQLTEGAENRDISFMNSEYLESKGLVPDRDRYTLVYTFEGPSPEELSVPNFLNSIYDQFNNDHPDDYMGRSLSVSDVVVVRIGQELQAHYVDSFGFKELENFGEVHREVPQQENKIESVADVEKRMASGETVNLMDLHKAIENERKTQKPTKAKAKSNTKAKAEKKPSVLGAIEEIKKNSPQQSNSKPNEKGVEL